VHPIAVPSYRTRTEVKNGLLFTSFGPGPTPMHGCSGNWRRHPCLDTSPPMNEC